MEKFPKKSSTKTVNVKLTIMKFRIVSIGNVVRANTVHTTVSQWWCVRTTTDDTSMTAWQHDSMTEVTIWNSIITGLIPLYLWQACIEIQWYQSLPSLSVSASLISVWQSICKHEWLSARCSIEFVLICVPQETCNNWRQTCREVIVGRTICVRQIYWELWSYDWEYFAEVNRI